MLVLLEWIGTVCGITGALMISSNTKFSAWGWWFFLASSLSLCQYAFMQNAWGLLLLNVCFVGTNLTGVFRWWLPTMTHKAVTPQTTPAAA